MFGGFFICRILSYTRARGRPQIRSPILEYVTAL